MAEFPYTPKPSSLANFLATIQTVGRPEKVTIKYIESLGFTSSNDRYVRGILKSLGFLDSSGVPTERWQIYRNKQRATTELATAIHETYSELFSVYPDAHRKDDEALRNFFTSKTSVGERTVYYMVSTFKTLCELADFSPVSQSSPAIQQDASLAITAHPLPEKTTEAIIAEAAVASQGITVNVNIQLTLPETKDSSIYDKIFESLKKHLLSR